MHVHLRRDILETSIELRSSHYFREFGGVMLV